MEYTKKQQEFFDALEAGENIFLTGKAGTGKSTAVNVAMDRMKQQLKKFVACAPTGVAANNINGVTIHSQFRIPPFGIQSADTAQFLSDAKRKVLRVADRLFIDEVSMMTPDILDAMQWTLKKNGLKGLEKRQLIFVGDLKQLPPVLKDNARTVLYSRYDGEEFMNAEIFKQLAVRVIELDEVVRQNDPEFIEALNVIREGGKHDYFRRFVSKAPSGIILAPYNATVKEYNEAGLRAQEGQAFVFTAEVEGEVKPEEFNVDREIVVKNGCKIMYMVNSTDPHCPLRNGTLGIFHSERGLHFIRVGKIDHAIYPQVFVKKEYIYDKEKDELILREVGRLTQMPIKLAYALSIHKSQGLTFDEVTVDLRRPCFQNGQMYVALSRVRTPAGLKILTQ